MKCGIDINSDKILKFISKKLKERGNFIIDFTEIKDINVGKVLIKKVLMANVTNIDFYFAIDFKNNINSAEIFYDDSNSSKRFGEILKSILDYRYEDIEFKNGEYLYLIKYIKSPVVYAGFPIQDKEMLENLLLGDKIIQALENIKI